MNTAALQLELERLRQRHGEQPEGRLFAPLADCLRKLGQLDEALQTCQEGLSRHPRYASARVILGKILRDRGQQEEAREAFEAVLDLDPQNLVALHHLARDAESGGRKEQARRFWQQLVQLEPDSEEAQEHLERLSAGPSGEEEPSALESEAPEAEPSEPPVPAAEATQARPRVGEERPLPPGDIATITLADIYYEQGFKTKALSIYREVLARSPHTPGVAERVARLEGEMEQEAAAEPPTTTLREVEGGVGGQVLSAGLVEDEEATVEVTRGDPLPSSEERAEDERYDHFRSWLGRIKVRDS